MRPVCTAEQIRAAEAAFFATHPGVDLMRRAADRVAEAANDLLGAGQQVLVVVGAGNNGGDALLAAAALALAGRRVSIWLVFGRADDAAIDQAAAAGCDFLNRDEAGELLPTVDLVIDGLTGIGGRAGLPSEVVGFAAECRRRNAQVLAVDLPSGLSADSHATVESFFSATMTITFAAEKLCHVARPAADRCGRVVVADIGLDLPAVHIHQVETSDLLQRWPVPDALSDKYSRGVIGIDTGSARYRGAAVLGVIGASCSGAGLVRYTGPVAEPVIAACPSAVVAPGRVGAMVIGSGWAERDDGRFARAVAAGVPLVVDAEALRSLPAELPAGSVLTPHAGELAGLLGVERADVLADPIGHAVRAAGSHGCVVLLKGASQYIAAPDGTVLLAIPGPAWTAQAGSGDVLAGICGTLLAAGLTAQWAAALAASLQALTATSHPGPYPPDMLARFMPAVLAGTLSRG